MRPIAKRAMKPGPADFWTVAQRQKRLSLLSFGLLFIFYFFTTGIISAAFLLGLGLFVSDLQFWGSQFFLRYVLILLLVTAFLTFLNFWQARKSGANFILNRLQAYPPQDDDRYHLSFQNVLEEISLASGLPAVKGYIIPSLNINSFSIIDRDNRPAVGVTEGLLAEVSRDELQAVVAHEVAHIKRGDTYLLTLVCSLASFYEKLVNSLEREREGLSPDILYARSRQETIHPLLYLASSISLLLVNFLSVLISRQRELLADATAVELGRDPVALARVIYKAHVANSFLGDFSLYTPLFLVPPDSREITESFWDKLFNTHPPVMKRLRLLTSMAHKSISEMLSEIKEQEQKREKARIMAQATEEMAGAKPEKNSISELPSTREEDKVWMVRKAGGGWEGPFSINSLLALPFFSPGIRVKNIRENIEGRAGNFAVIRKGMYNLWQQRAIDSRQENNCPRCQVELVETYYEGVKIKKCLHCQGKLIPLAAMEKIFARHEIGFSPQLKEKSKKIKQEIVSMATLKRKPPAKQALFCPQCGLQMAVKPYSYQYLFPVHKCFHCGLIWFEADDLETLQCLVEQKDL